ncbi:hypothetical protein C9J22_19925 [Photobacterium phosphoreum]|uniref:hypothetical protein n=1 Tax=Photobacterium phosphoreum TaxID=659 RepID=UPI000D17309F|nr:hypothetical protein [Photobacterium phosphoreum]PSU67282.1 hypothetical protein C9J22_19925 [Photobacterium phosphoreum]
MTILLWSKMPSKWIAESGLKLHFSSNNKVSDDIAALKIFIVLCYLSKEVNRSGSEKKNNVFEAKVTYDQFTVLCSLSRALVSRGLKKLKSSNLLEVSGVRTKTYTLKNSAYSGWGKLPKRALVHNDEKIPVMAVFLNRNLNERNALKLFLYIIASRSNSKRYVDLSRGIIMEKTGIELNDIDAALGILCSSSLITNVEDKGYKVHLSRQNRITNLQDKKERLHRYWVIGNETLNYKTVIFDSDDCR